METVWSKTGTRDANFITTCLGARHLLPSLMCKDQRCWLGNGVKDVETVEEIAVAKLAISHRNIGLPVLAKRKYSRSNMLAPLVPLETFLSLLHPFLFCIGMQSLICDFLSHLTCTLDLAFQSKYFLKLHF